jgi:hypothetical protein
LAVYVLPEDVWYIIPKPVLRGQASVAPRPAAQNSKYAKYLGAWELMKLELKVVSEASADRISIMLNVDWEHQSNSKSFALEYP